MYIHSIRNLIVLFSALFCLAGLNFQAVAANNNKAPKVTKERLVLMPLRVDEEDKNLQGAMETALAQGLQHKYEVFSGEQVAQKAREIFLKESHSKEKKECDETRCMQGIAEAFQAELIATANVTKRDNGYFLALSIQNIFDNLVVFSNAIPCRNCDAFLVVDKLKELSGFSNSAGSPIESTKINVAGTPKFGTPKSVTQNTIFSTKGKLHIVKLHTNKGVITLQLDAEKAPVTVKNFLEYVNSGFYSNTIFHRVINNFMIQGGGFDPNMHKKTTNAPIKNEADNGLKNDIYTIAMARTNDPQSATSQFFINVVDNNFLNYTSPDSRGWGYCVFGKVVDGKEVVDAIQKVKTGGRSPFGRDVPIEDIVITKAEEIK